VRWPLLWEGTTRGAVAKALEQFPWIRSLQPFSSVQLKSSYILVGSFSYSMGVPGLAGWLIRRYPWILSAVSDGESAEDDDGVQAHCDEVRCRSFAEECSASERTLPRSSVPTPFQLTRQGQCVQPPAPHAIVYIFPIPCERTRTLLVKNPPLCLTQPNPIAHISTPPIICNTQHTHTLTLTLTHQHTTPSSTSTSTRSSMGARTRHGARRRSSRSWRRSWRWTPCWAASSLPRAPQ
jgi:hypothetical protein